MKLTRERLLELFVYDHTEPAALRWKADSHPRAKRGAIAGTIGFHDYPYRYISVDGVSVSAARAVWLIHKGALPKGKLFFVNGDASDCRIQNLREKHGHDERERRRVARRKRLRRIRAGELGEPLQRAERDKKFREAYGISLEEYETMVVAQGNKCAICGSPETSIRNGSPMRLSVDHCHGSRRVRALLCGGCNGGLGRFRDDPKLLRAAADYLEHHAASRSRPGL